MTNVLAFKSDQATHRALAARAASSFSDLLKRPVDQAKGAGVPEGMPARGPYNSQILYLNGGTPHFGTYCETERLRCKRQYTENAVELRCDALAVAIYLSGFKQYQVNTPEGRKATGNQVTKYGGIRMFAYQHRDLQPIKHVTIGGPNDVLATVHGCFVELYNSLALKYNIAGLPDSWLTLKSSHPEIFPHITLRLEDAERMLER